MLFVPSWANLSTAQGRESAVTNTFWVLHVDVDYLRAVIPSQLCDCQLAWLTRLLSTGISIGCFFSLTLNWSGLRCMTLKRDFNELMFGREVKQRMKHCLIFFFFKDIASAQELKPKFTLLLWCQWRLKHDFMPSFGWVFFSQTRHKQLFSIIKSYEIMVRQFIRIIGCRNPPHVCICP